jgi:hypothetical protein
VAPNDHMPKCSAKKRNGDPCGQPRMRGLAVCRSHGGKNPVAQNKGLERFHEAEIMERANKYGTPRNISAVDAMEEERARTQGIVDHLEKLISENPNDAVLLGLYMAERQHLSKLTKDALTLGVDERRIRLETMQVDMLESAIDGIVSRLGHDPHTTRVRTIIAEVFRNVIGYREQPQGTVDAEIVDADESWYAENFGGEVDFFK